MIPKIIHYCWFGGKAKPELAEKCIESWKKFCPDYEIVEWNEDNFDINSNLYVKQAYEARKFAFVSDYARLYALYTHGGIYMDTDVMLLKPLDEYLSDTAFMGFEAKGKIATCVIGSMKSNSLIADFLKYYDERAFITDNGTYDVTTNVETITGILLSNGLKPNGHAQTVCEMSIYPQNIFSPSLHKLDNASYMKDTVAIHYFSGSWKSDATKKRESSLWWKIIAVPLSFVSRIMRKLFGDKWEQRKNKIRDKILKND